MFDHAAPTQIDRLAAAHQQHLDNQACDQYCQETEEEKIKRNPLEVRRALENFGNAEWSTMSLLIGQLVAQYQYHGEERNQGILDVAEDIFQLASLAISEQATYNRRKSMRGAA